MTEPLSIGMFPYLFEENTGPPVETKVSMQLQNSELPCLMRGGLAKVC